MIRVKRLSPVLFALALASVLHGPARGQQRRPSIAVVCSQTATGILNPLISPDLIATDLRLALFTPAVLYDDKGGVRPHAISSWSWSPDHKQLTLQVRNDLKWHDGQPLTAEDVAWTIRTAGTKEYAFKSLPDFAQLKSVTVEAGAVKLEYNVASAAGMEPFTSLVILPKHVLEKVAPAEFAKADFQRSPIGSGPFKFVSRGADNSIVLDRFEGFPAALGKPAIDRIVLKAIPEASAVAAELQTGNADFCITTSAVISLIRNTQTLRYAGLPPAGVQVLALNTKQEPLTDPRVRRALSAALNRTEVAAVVSPVAQVTRTVMWLGSPYVNPSFRQPDQDLALAEQLLTSAGWKRGSDGMRVNAEGKPLRITVVAPQQLQPSMTVIQSQWRKAGVDLDLRLMEWAAYVSMLQNPTNRPEAMALGIFPSRVLTPDFSDQLHSKSPRNLSAFASARADSALERLRTTQDEKERRALYDALQAIVADEIPSIYVLLAPRIGVIGPRLQGVQFDQNGAFATVSQWRVVAK